MLHLVTRYPFKRERSGAITRVAVAIVRVLERCAHRDLVFFTDGNDLYHERRNLLVVNIFLVVNHRVSFSLADPAAFTPRGPDCYVFSVCFSRMCGASFAKHSSP